jgi:acetylornithine deacetylase
MVEKDLQQRILAEIKDMKEEMVATLQKIIRIPSLVGNERKAQEYIREIYQSLGLEVVYFQPDIEKVKKHPAFINTGMSYENRPNIIGILRGDAISPSLILHGHIDVVSPEPISEWTHNPWGAEIEGDRMYGRGAGDMKAGLVSNFFALKAILKAGLKPKGTVMLQSTIDEEAGGAGGALACLMEGYRADAMISSEPHNLNVTISHCGVNYFRVRVLGKTSHAGLGHLGVNAIGKMYLIYDALRELDEKRGKEIRFPLYEKGSGRSCHLNVGTLKAGDWPSTVAGSAEMECRIGYIPGEKMVDIKKLVERTIHDAAQKDSWLRDHPPLVEWFGWQTEPWYQDADHPFVKTLKRAAEDVLGHEVQYVGRAGGNDCRFTQYFNMIGALTGPKAGNIHGIDEYVEIPTIIQTTEVIAMTVLRWCGQADSAP